MPQSTGLRATGAGSTAAPFRPQAPVVAAGGGSPPRATASGRPFRPPLIDSAPVRDAALGRDALSGRCSWDSEEHSGTVGERQGNAVAYNRHLTDNPRGQHMRPLGSSEALSNLLLAAGMSRLVGQQPEAFISDFF